MTSAQIAIMTTIILYLCLVIFTGVMIGKRSKKSAEGFYLGGRGMGPLVTAMSAEASDMSSYLLMGIPGLAYLSGVADASWTAIGLAIAVRPVDLRIYADRAMIEQVLINLLKNAVEACQERPYPEVRVNAFRREGVPVITVSDNGYGIVPEAMDKVFVPFFTTKQGGSGIGLSVCRQIMNRHGGSISVISEEEKGTTFTLQFPQTRVL